MFDIAVPTEIAMLTLNINTLGSGTTMTMHVNSCRIHFAWNMTPLTLIFMSNFSVTLVQSLPELCFGTTIRQTNQPMNYSPSLMKHSFTFASSTTVQPGWPKKRGNREIIVCKHKCFLAKMFYQNIGPSSVHVFHIYWVYFSSKKNQSFFR